ncbi:hypothetical protein AB4Y42_41940 [Paraburkholderia sp. EG286B]|uniref:hypothetical protein n=1 Tax=unclassified Paraburkholderia TaxID=2615204 RepID=UPI0034D23F33
MKKADDGSTIRFKRSSTGTYVVLTRDEYTRLLDSPEVKDGSSLAADVWHNEYLKGFPGRGGGKTDE